METVSVWDYKSDYKRNYFLSSFIFYSLCDLAILSRGRMKKKKKNYQNKNKTKFSVPTEYIFYFYEIFSEIFVHLATLTKCYYKKKPQQVLFGKNLIFVCRLPLVRPSRKKKRQTMVPRRFMAAISTEDGGRRRARN